MYTENYDDCIYPIHDLPTEEQKEVQETNMSFGEMLRAQAEQRKWNTKKVGKKLGCAQTTVSNYYNNNNCPTLKTREIIAVVFGVSVALQEEYILKTKWTYQIVYRQSDGTLKITSTPEVKARQLESARRAKEKKKTPKLLPLAKKLQKEVQEEAQEERSESQNYMGTSPLTILLNQAEKGTVFLYHNNDLYSLSKV